MNLFTSVDYALYFMPTPFRILIGVAFAFVIVFILIRLIITILDAIPFV